MSSFSGCAMQSKPWPASPRQPAVPSTRPKQKPPPSSPTCAKKSCPSADGSSTLKLAFAIWERRGTSSLRCALLLIPRRFGGGVAAGDAAEGEAFADIAGALIQVTVDRPEFAGAVEPRDWGAVGPHDLGSFIAARAALGVEHRGGQLDRVERPIGDRFHHQGSAKLRIV